ncbi:MULTISPECIES: HtaA domain-containing protein [unclassified Streptomyces]|uniref:HtaA domain-containing protein n=1 Tax=unclassified Streptomyces TaxID=2593676 RepID=UPI003818FBBB
MTASRRPTAARRPIPARRPIALTAAVATAAALGATALATLGATSASAAEIPLSGYELTWGIKQSYRSYVVAPYTQGSFTTVDGASQAAGNGAFTFTGGQGTYDSTKHTLHLAFQGSVTARSTAHGFVRTLSDFQYDSGKGTLTADLKADDQAVQQDVVIAQVAAPTSQEMTGLATTLTPEAAAFLGSPSYSGAAGDPLDVVKKAAPSPSTSASPSTSTSPSASSSPSSSPSPSTSASASASPSTSPSGSASPSTPPSTPAPTAPAQGSVADGTLTWGVKQSFRSYVVGNVAKGKVTTAGGATQAAGNGAFTFPDATGSYDTDEDTLSASFKGTVNFKGHQGAGEDGGYGLDLTLGDLKARLADGTGTLTADLTSLGVKSDDVVLADLKAADKDLTAEDDVLTVDDVTATLTAAGAKAFSGFYQAGEALDPVALSLALTDDAELPGGDNGGSTSGGSSGSGGSGDTSGGTTGGAGTTGSTTGGAGTTGGSVGGSMAATGSDVPVGALGAAAGGIVLAGAAAVYVARRRRTDETGPTA